MLMLEYLFMFTIIQKANNTHKSRKFLIYLTRAKAQSQSSQ